ncbi:MAG: hypothetical protein ACTSVD_06995, partial [Candidatus Thorarchaeota archaeon]
AYAAAGAVKLDSSGVTIKGTGYLRIQKSDGTLVGYLDGTAYLGTDAIALLSTAGKLLVLDAGGDTVKLTPGGAITISSNFSRLKPGSDKGVELGQPGTAFLYYLPVYASKPTAGSSYLGMPIIVRSGSGAKSYIYVCVQNSSDGYEWVQLAIST